MNSTNEFLSENRSSYPPSFKFDEVGKAIAGTLVEPPRKVEGTDFDGNPQTSWVFEIDTGDDTFSVWAPVGKGLARAIAKAVADAGVTEFGQGDKIKIVRTEDGEPPKPHFQPPHRFEVAYKPKQPTVSVDDF